jgi:phosphoglycerate-specific signal transduction histidine kinase
MFSKEWFIYVFGRWLLLSGIAGALLQFLLTDKLGFWTIPAFLLNQLILACVFWYVDKYIFQRHLGKVKDIFKFPRVKGKFTIGNQISKIEQEYQQLANSYNNYVSCDAEQDRKQFDDFKNKFVDLYHSIEMTERVLREYGVDIDKEYSHVIEENKKRGLYGDKE